MAKSRKVIAVSDTFHGFYGPSSASGRKLRAGKGLPFSALMTCSLTVKPSPGPSGSSIYPFTGLSTSGQIRRLISSKGRKYSVIMKFGMQAAACTVAESDIVVEL